VVDRMPKTLVIRHTIKKWGADSSQRPNFAVSPALHGNLSR